MNCGITSPPPATALAWEGGGWGNVLHASHPVGARAWGRGEAGHAWREFASPSASAPLGQGRVCGENVGKA